MDLDNVVYRGEGNSSIVFSCDKEQVVYRVFKKLKGSDYCESAAELKNKHERVVRYIKHVIKPLLGSHLITEGELVHLSSKTIEYMMQIQDIPNLRPEQRLKSCINSATSLALKLPDVCFLRNNIKHDSPMPTITIEIKSKHGFLPRDTQTDKRVCRFCLKQNLKKKIGQTKSISRFCPVDLYSGNRSRMNHALKMLLETPQNNMRLFVDGNLIFSEEKQDREFVSILCEYFVSSNNLHDDTCTESGVIDTLCDVIISCLLTPYNGTTSGSTSVTSPELTSTCENNQQYQQHPFLTQQSPLDGSSGDRNSNHLDPGNLEVTSCDKDATTAPDVFPQTITQTNAQTNNQTQESDAGRRFSSSLRSLQHCDKSSYGNCDTEVLPEGCVLSRLQNCQLLGVDGINHMYPHYKQILELVEHNNLLKEQFVHCPYEDYLTSCDEFKDTQLNDLVNKLRRYKIARTFMDACIMVTMQPLPQSIDPGHGSAQHHVVQDRHGNAFQFELTVIDLDPKDMSRMDKWKSEEDEIQHLATLAHAKAQ